MSFIFPYQFDGYIQAIRDLDNHPEAQNKLCTNVLFMTNITIERVDKILEALSRNTQNYEMVKVFKNKLLKQIEQENN